MPMRMLRSSSLPVFWAPSYCAAGQAGETFRKSPEVAERIQARLATLVDLIEPDPITLAELHLVHDPAYVARTLAGDPALAASLLASTGGVRDALASAIRGGLAGSLSSGLHHARRGSYAGFCHFNGLALAAHLAVGPLGLATVGILDVDAHCGGGTHSLVGDDAGIRIADVSVNGYDHWDPTDDRHSLEVVSSPDGYLPAVDRALAHLRGVDLVIVNAGVDAHEHAGGLRGITTETIARREATIAEWIRDRGCAAMFVLAGGYCDASAGVGLGEVADLHMHVVTEFAALARERSAGLPA